MATMISKTFERIKNWLYTHSMVKTIILPDDYRNFMEDTHSYFVKVKYTIFGIIIKASEPEEYEIKTEKFYSGIARNWVDVKVGDDFLDVMEFERTCAICCLEDKKEYTLYKE